MQNTRIFRYLNDFSAQEAKDFKQYLENFHSGAETAILVYRELYRRHPFQEGATHLSRAAIYEGAFGEPYDPGDRSKVSRLTNSFTWLVKHLQDFLVQRELNQNDLRRKLILLHTIKRRSMASEYLQLLSEVKKELETPERTYDLWTFFDYFQQLHFSYFTNLSLKFTGKAAEDIQQLWKELNEFYITAVLKYGCELINRKVQMDEEANLEPCAMAEEWVQKRGFSNLLQELYYHAYQLIRYRAEESYRKLKERLLAQWELLDKEDQDILLLNLINFCSGRIKKKETRFYTETKELYLLGLREGVFLENGSFSRMTLSNAIEPFLHEKRYGEALGMLKKWGSYLRPETRATSIRLIEALIHLHRGDWGAVIENLRDVAPEDDAYKITQKALLLAAYVKYYDPSKKENRNFLLGECRKFIRLLNKKKFSSWRNQPYQNFESIIRLLIKKHQKRREVFEIYQKTNPIYRDFFFRREFREFLEE